MGKYFLNRAGTCWNISENIKPSQTSLILSMPLCNRLLCFALIISPLTAMNGFAFACENSVRILKV